MIRVTSADGTTIACERLGAGPALILVDGALCRRAFGPSRKIAEALSTRFTVYIYDRRGRGDSSDTTPYAPAREVEDLAAVIEEAGGRAALVGLSSGAALALEAAASGLPVTTVVAYEPPYVDHDSPGGEVPRRAGGGRRLSGRTRAPAGAVGNPHAPPSPLHAGVSRGGRRFPRLESVPADVCVASALAAPALFVQLPGSRSAQPIEVSPVK